MLQKDSNYTVLIVSGDHVFAALMQTMLKQFLKGADIVQLHSFNAIRESGQLESCQLLLLGDIVEGARGLEVLDYLRVKRKFVFPIAFFCDDIADLRQTALRRGSNFCYTKPLKPDRIVLDLLQKVFSTDIESV